MNVFIFHGTKSSPQDNWFLWLKRELSKEKIKVYLPEFPTPKGQNLDNWLKTFEQYREYLDKDSVLVGHSMGTVLGMRIVERLDFTIKGCVLVAPFYKLLNKQFTPLIKSFVDHPFDWEKMRNNCEQWIVYAGDKDPYVPIEQPREIAKKLRVKIRIIKDGGHLGGVFEEKREMLEEIKLALHSQGKVG